MSGFRGQRAFDAGDGKDGGVEGAGQLYLALALGVVMFGLLFLKTVLGPSPYHIVDRLHLFRACDVKCTCNMCKFFSPILRRTDRVLGWPTVWNLPGGGVV